MTSIGFEGWAKGPPRTRQLVDVFPIPLPIPKSPDHLSHAKIPTLAPSTFSKDLRTSRTREVTPSLVRVAAEYARARETAGVTVGRARARGAARRARRNIAGAGCEDGQWSRRDANDC